MKEKKQKKQADPNQWFGYLPPATLKRAQRDFINAIPVVISLANKQQEVKMLEEKYYTLLKQKAQLQQQKKS